MYEDLLKSGALRHYDASETEVLAALDRAHRDLATAESLLGADADWALGIAYNAALQAGRALVFAEGYRPRSIAGHKAVFLFLGEALGREHTDLVDYFDHVRVTRHAAVYDTCGSVSDGEAEYVLKRARQIVLIIIERLPDRTRQTAKEQFK